MTTRKKLTPREATEELFVLIKRAESIFSTLADDVQEVGILEGYFREIISEWDSNADIYEMLAKQPGSKVHPLPGKKKRMKVDFYLPSTSEETRLQGEVYRLEGEAVVERKRKLALKDEIKRLTPFEVENASLKQEIEEWKKKFSDLAREKYDTEEEILRLKAEYDLLADEAEKLQQDYETVLQELAKLRP